MSVVFEDLFTMDKRLLSIFQLKARLFICILTRLEPVQHSRAISPSNYYLLFIYPSVVLPGMTAEGKRTDFSPLSEHDGLIERYKSKNLDGILELHNKTPVWNDETQSYVLNFHGRVTQVE